MSTPVSFGDPTLSDVTLVVEKEEFLAHKMVLASRSDVFKAMFYGEFKEANEDRIEIKEVSWLPFKYLMELVYTGTITNRAWMLPCQCNIKNQQPNDAYYRKYAIAGYWSNGTNISQLLEVADRFNLTKIVMNELTNAFCQIKCYSEHCFRCMCICFILIDREGLITSIDREFDRSFMADLAGMIVQKSDSVVVNSKMRSFVNLLKHVS